METVSRERMGAGHPTPGMDRREAFAHEGAWAGTVTMAPGIVSGWHHHGGHASYLFVRSGRARFETPDGGAHECEPGHFIFIPPREVHREVNPGKEPSEVVLFRVGTGELVVNVEREARPTY